VLKFNRGENYLYKIESISKYKSKYLCLLCGKLKELHDYKVNNGHDKSCGCVNSKTSPFIITKEGEITSPTGYSLTCKCGKGYLGFRGEYVHRIIANIFIPNVNGYLDVNHINGDKKDNRVVNLEWCTRSSNIKHAWSTGLNQGVTGKPSFRRKLDNGLPISTRNTKGTTMERLILAVCCIGLLSGCGKTTSVDAVIVKIVDDKSSMGCMGTDKRTVIRTTSGNTSYVCGEYGREGDKIRGYWTEGSFDPTQNGFSLTR